MDTFKRLLCVVLFCACVQMVRGHGAAQTSIRLNVYEGRVEACLEVTMPDLIKMVGAGMRSEIKSAPGDLREFALEYQGEVQKHFKLIDGDNHVLLPTSAWAQLPDFESSAVRNLGLDQQRIELVLGYVFDSPPESLAVVFELGQDHHGDPVYADCILRQNDELIMLPEKVGPGFAMQFDFVWDEPVQAIRGLSDLDQASVRWQNRPVVSYLHSDDTRIVWSVVAPLSAWGELAFDLSRMSGHSLAEILAEGFSIRSDGSDLKLLHAQATRYRLNSFDYRRGRQVKGGDPDNTLVRLDMSFDGSAASEWMEASCVVFPARSQRVFLSAWVNDQREVFNVLHPKANSFRWNTMNTTELSQHLSPEQRR